MMRHCQTKHPTLVQHAPIELFKPRSIDLLAIHREDFQMFFGKCMQPDIYTFWRLAKEGNPSPWKPQSPVKSSRSSPQLRAFKIPSDAPILDDSSDQTIHESSIADAPPTTSEPPFTDAPPTTNESPIMDIPSEDPAPTAIITTEPSLVTFPVTEASCVISSATGQPIVQTIAATNPSVPAPSPSPSTPRYTPATSIINSPCPTAYQSTHTFLPPQLTLPDSDIAKHLITYGAMPLFPPSLRDWEPKKQ